jgi:hypothetical protein
VGTPVERYKADLGILVRWRFAGRRDGCLGGPFAYDPFGLDRGGVLSNPNMLVFWQIGRSRSAFVKR